MGQYIQNEIWSPLIPWPGADNAAVMEFDVYEDLPVDNLVAYTWKIRYWVGGVPSTWFTDGEFYFGASKKWERFRTPPITVPAAAATVQVALGCVDKCIDWCGIAGSGACHSHAPLFDNVRVLEVTAEPRITSIKDVGNDQGRRVRIRWDRSGADDVLAIDPVVEYAIYRRQDQFLTASAAIGRDAVSTPRGAEGSPLLADWDFVMTVPARGDLEYQAVVPTLCDSTVLDGQCWSVFFVSASVSPAVFFDSPPDSGYSLDNLSPDPPSSFSVAYNVPGGNELTWDESDAPDFNYFNVYRGSSPGLISTMGDLVFSTSGTSWQDATGTYAHHYTITSVDFSGNESDASSPTTLTGIGDAPSARFALHHAVPNPFQASTLIRYDVPADGAHVSIRVYDASGRLVATLRDGPDAAGERSIQWSGRDRDGKSVASGVYFCRMSAPGFVETRKLVILR